MQIIKKVGKKIQHGIFKEEKSNEDQVKQEKYIAKCDKIKMDKVNLHSIYNKKNSDSNKKNGDMSSREYVKNNIQNHLQPDDIQKKKDQAKPNYDKQYQKFSKLLNQTMIDYRELKSLSWNGIPPLFRSMVWKIILDYQPTNKLNCDQVLKRKREEYWQYVEDFFNPMEELDENEQKMRKIVLKDVPRTQPDYEIFKHPRVTAMLERILYIWNIRHPACGYVQGMNEIVTPLIVVFLSEFIELDGHIYEIPDNIHTVTREQWDIVEADSYWCLNRILDRIQDNYTNGQPGIKKNLNKMQQIVTKLDPELAEHFANQQVQFVQFAFRWILCLLVREFSLDQVLRIFDTYISDENGFQTLHIYVCSVVLLKFSNDIKSLKFNEIIMFLQNMPTKSWLQQDTEDVLQQGYVYATIYEQSQGHIKQTDGQEEKWF